MEDEKLEMLNGRNLNERKETDCSPIPFLQLRKMRYERMFPFRWWESRSSDGEEFNFESALPLLKAQHFVVVYTSFSGKEKGLEWTREGCRLHAYLCRDEREGENRIPINNPLSETLTI